MFSSILLSDERKLCYLKKLPSAIFIFIVTYLEEKDSSQFLKSSPLLFNDIKPYTFKISALSHFSRRKGYGKKEGDLDSQFRLFNEMRRYAQSKGPQTKVRLYYEYPTDFALMKYASIYTNIYEIYLQYLGEISNDFDYSIFNNINKITLHLFTEVKHIRHGFRNIHHLTLIELPNLISIDCPLMNLDSLNIIDCDSLTSIASLENIKEIHFDSCRNLFQSFPLDLSKTKDTLRRFSFPDMPRHIRLNQIPCHSLEYLDLSNYIPWDDEDLNLLVNIPELKIRGEYDPIRMRGTDSENSDDDDDDDDGIYLTIPVFHSKYLSLSNCSLYAWGTTTTTMTNLLSLSLSDCCHCFDLPIFPNLRTLSLTRLEGLYEIKAISLPKLIRLEMIECHDIHYLPRFPIIQEMIIQDCQLFKILGGYDKKMTSLKKVHFQSLPSFEKFACLRNIPEVILSHFRRNEFNWDGFDQSLLFKEQRKVSFHRCHFVQSLSWKGMGKIGKLTFIEVTGINKKKLFEDIHDVDHLICKGIEGLEGVGEEGEEDDEDILNRDNFKSIEISRY